MDFKNKDLRLSRGKGFAVVWNCRDITSPVFGETKYPCDVFRSLELGIKLQSLVAPWRKYNANEPCEITQLLLVAGPAAHSRGS